MGWNIFGSVVDTVGDVAKEWIQTDLESAEAKSLMLKVLDPNGKMRRDISNKVSNMYIGYISITAILVLAQSFSVGDAIAVEKAIVSLTDLFVPITTMFTAIVGASFGTNISNNIKDSKVEK